jgi:hypothetical protein
MADPIVVSQLMAKRSELAGLVEAKRLELNTLLRDLDHISRDTLRFVKENVELLGQRFMLIENPQNLDAPTEQIIQLVVSRFKRVDVFIDLSAGNSEQPGVITSNQSPANWRRSNWSLMLAVVRGFAKP